MQNITTSAELKNAIQVLELEQAVKGQLLKEQFYITIDSLKPVNLLKGTMKEIVSSPYLIENILGNVLKFATGYVSQKVVVGASGGIVRKILGSMLQFGVTNIVAQHPDAIKTLSHMVRGLFKKEVPIA